MNKTFITLTSFAALSIAQAQITETGGTITSGPEDGTGVGLSISQDGNTLAVGDRYWNNPNGANDQGRVRLYKMENGAWVAKGNAITATGQFQNIPFWMGSSLDLSPNGNRVVVGMPYTPNSSFETGKGGMLVRDYNASSNSWSNVGNVDAIVANYGGSQNYFGRAVRLFSTASASYAAMTSFTYNSSRGRVSIWRLDGSNWVPFLQLDGAQPGQNAGYEIDAKNNRLLVGSPQLGDSQLSGFAQILNLDASGSFEVVGQSLLGPEPGCGFGRSLEMSTNDRVIIGAWRYNGAGTERGYAACYEFNGTSWELLGSPFIGQTDGNNLGFGVCINDAGNLVAVSEMNDDTNGTDAGLVKVYNLENNEWNLIGTVYGDEEGDKFGYTIRMDGTRLAVGAQGSGYVRTFDITSSSLNTYEINEIAIKEAALYPNPAQNTLNIASYENLAQLKIVSLAGTVVKNLELNGTTAQIDLSGLNKGSYVVCLTFSDGTEQKDNLIIE